jgi:hypothetical protein
MTYCYGRQKDLSNQNNYKMQGYMFSFIHMAVTGMDNTGVHNVLMPEVALKSILAVSTFL